jgi:hypothetical protein
MRQLQESTWDIVDLVDVNLTVVAGTTVTTVGTVTVIATVVATAAKTVITTAATGTGAIAGALLQRATTDAAEVSPGALPRVNAAPHAVLTEEITKLLLPIHLLKRPRAGKGSEWLLQVDWIGMAAACFISALPLSSVSYFCLYLTLSCYE